MKQYLDSEIASLTDLLSFESVLSEPKPGMPFGENIFGALDYMLKLGASFGFETFNDEGFAGHIDFGYDKEVFAVLCHLDVVPAGKFWTMPPFKGTVKDNKIYGRGALDNKGPAIAVLYAMKKLYDEGHIPKRKLRLILGCNEESGWQCMEHYNKSVGLPKTGFSPDSDFPVINAEKGVLQLEITFKNTSNKLTKFEGGNRVNMVADNCEFDFDGKTFSYSGKSAHGSKPEKGDNAIFKAFKELLTLTEDKTLKFINSNFVNNTDGKKIGLNIKDEISGNLTLNFGTIELKEDKIICEIDIRYPINSEKETILNKLKTLLSEINAEIKVINYHKPLYVDENSDLIKNLLKAYKKVTNLETKCVSIGGATYARVLEKGVAFGPIFPEEISTIHEADEFISIENLLKITKIYYEALKQF